MSKHILLTAGACALLAVAVQAQYPVSSTAKVGLDTSIPSPTITQVDISITGAEGPAFLVMAALGQTAPTNDQAWMSLGIHALQSDGTGLLSVNLPRKVAASLPPIHVKAMYLADGNILQTPMHSSTLAPKQYSGVAPPGDAFDLSWGLGGVPQSAGAIISDTQPWASMVTVSGINNVAGHPDGLILFDSAMPTGGDTDLATPGYGPGNTTALGMLAIVPENIVDGNVDGLVDDPDDEAGGGTIVFAFASQVRWGDFVVVDVDSYETGGEVRYYDGLNLVATHPLQALGDNSAQTVPGAVGITRVEVQLAGSGGVAAMRIYPCETTVNFDQTTTGVPLGMLAGQVISDDLGLFGNLGLVFTAVNGFAGHPDEAIIFDTDNPTGGDTDLATPGYGLDNTINEHMVIIIPEDNIDLNNDGLVDNPDDEAGGGSITMDWLGACGTFRGATILDVDTYETAYIEVVLCAQGDPSVFIPLVSKGDNSSQTVDVSIGPASRVIFHLGGSGTVTDIRLCPDFDN